MAVFMTAVQRANTVLGLDLLAPRSSLTHGMS